MQLFEYAIIYVPRDDEDKIKRDECRVLVEPKTMLATDEKAVNLRAAREIEEGVDLDFVQVAVRPF